MLRGWGEGQGDGKDCSKINDWLVCFWWGSTEKCKAAECTEYNGDGSDLSAAKFRKVGAYISAHFYHTNFAKYSPLPAPFYLLMWLSVLKLSHSISCHQILPLHHLGCPWNSSDKVSREENFEDPFQGRYWFHSGLLHFILILLLFCLFFLLNFKFRVMNTLTSWFYLSGKLK